MSNKFEKFEIIKINRNEIHGADYNPRKISDAAFQKLKRKIRKDGLITPIVVNKRTMTVVGGHQRLRAMDEIAKKTDYDMSVAMIDVDENKEVELNIFRNNTSAMGEWDAEMLVDLKGSFQDIDFLKDCGFDKLDLDYMFSSAGIDEETIDSIFEETKEQKAILTDIEKIEQSDKMRKLKNEHKEKQKARNEETGDTHYTEHHDYYVCFVFNTNQEKRAFMEKIKRPIKEKYTKATFLHDIVKDEFRF